MGVRTISLILELAIAANARRCEIAHSVQRYCEHLHKKLERPISITDQMIIVMELPPAPVSYCDLSAALKTSSPDLVSPFRVTRPR